MQLGVDFSIKFKVNNQLSFPSDENSVNPVKLAVQVIKLTYIVDLTLS